MRGVHRFSGFTPDLSVYSKALGNGYAISACVGNNDLKNVASDVFLTGSCWNDSVAMRAALTSLNLCEVNGVSSSVTEKGFLFCKGMEELSRQYNYN